MGEKPICHVCKKEKKPCTLFIKNDIFSILQYLDAREDGEICQRCDQYHAMTGEFKDATKEEFEIANKSAWFARMMLKWWQKDKKTIVVDDKDNPMMTDFDKTREENRRDWEGTAMLANWCRKELTSRTPTNKNKR